MRATGLIGPRVDKDWVVCAVVYYCVERKSSRSQWNRGQIFCSPGVDGDTVCIFVASLVLRLPFVRFKLFSPRGGPLVAYDMKGGGNVELVEMRGVACVAAIGWWCWPA